MYVALLIAHSWLRWAVLIFGVIALVGALRKWRRKDLGPDRSSLGLLISADLQLVVGAALFFVSPFFTVLREAPGSAMADSTSRFFTVEHGPAMLVAIVLIHAGRIAGKRSVSPDRYRTAAILFALALLVTLAATPWPGLAWGRPLLRW